MHKRVVEEDKEVVPVVVDESQALDQRLEDRIEYHARSAVRNERVDNDFKNEIERLKQSLSRLKLKQQKIQNEKSKIHSSASDINELLESLNSSAEYLFSEGYR